MRRVMMVIGAVLAVVAVVLAIGAVRRGEDEASLWDEALGDNQ